MKTTADANPTKAFFIALIVRDVNITDCIKDLIDNSVDGMIRNSVGSSYKKFHVSLAVGADFFEIEDNCGGLELDIAQRYAFRFGKPDEEVERNKPIAGRYGIGMKRAVFKLGDQISISTQAKKSSFAMNIDVPEWRKDDKPPWTFAIQNAKEKDPARLEDTFTKIRITSLHKEVSEEFRDPLFSTRLLHDLEFAYADRLRAGLTIRLNGNIAHPQRMELLLSSKVKPLVRTEKIGNVTVRYNVGLTSQDNDEMRAMDLAGWYIFCNNRLLVAADKTAETGWGKENKNPSFHPQYNQFRGYVFFESNDVDSLPWNTAKNQLNTESAVYRATKPKLCAALREVVDYLNNRKSARSDDDSRYDRPLQSAKLTPIWDLPNSQQFKVALPKTAPKEPVQRISYERPTWMVEKAMEVLGVESAKEVGEETFDHYFERNCNGTGK